MNLLQSKEYSPIFGSNGSRNQVASKNLLKTFSAVFCLLVVCGLFLSSGKSVTKNVRTNEYKNHIFLKFDKALTPEERQLEVARALNASVDHLGLKSVLYVPYTAKGVDLKETAWFSNEVGTSGIMKYPTAGIKCKGPYCDDKKLMINDKNSDSPLLESKIMTKWFSEEIDSFVVCPDGTVVSEYMCRGKFCDGQRFRCAEMNLNYKIEDHDIDIVNPFSDEPPAVGDCADGYYFAGLMCTGAYCDNLHLYCKKILVNRLL